MSGACQQAPGAVAPVGERAPPRTVATLPPRNGCVQVQARVAGCPSAPAMRHSAVDDAPRRRGSPSFESAHSSGAWRPVRSYGLLRERLVGAAPLPVAFAGAFGVRDGAFADLVVFAAGVAARVGAFAVRGVLAGGFAGETAAPSCSRSFTRARFVFCASRWSTFRDFPRSLYATRAPVLASRPRACRASAASLSDFSKRTTARSSCLRVLADIAAGLPELPRTALADVFFTAGMLLTSPVFERDGGDGTGAITQWTLTIWTIVDSSGASTFPHKYATVDATPAAARSGRFNTGLISACAPGQPRRTGQVAAVPWTRYGNDHG
jgi:hypothetical protein